MYVTYNRSCSESICRYFITTALALNGYKQEQTKYFMCAISQRTHENTNIILMTLTSCTNELPHRVLKKNYAGSMMTYSRV